MQLSPLLKAMAHLEASDLFITVGMPPHVKVSNHSRPVGTQALSAEDCKRLMYEAMGEDEQQRFERELEMNLSHIEPGVGNFRVNVLKARGTVSGVIRYIRTSIPKFSTLKLPEVLLNLVMEKRGLILMVGSTGSGKSTSLASMIDHRNNEASGHILTVEDPIEYMYQPKRCVVNQREIGHDTRSYENALMNALREAPDLLLIGEIRDRATMTHAITHALTGNLCLSTLHATNSYHALSRILTMYPQDARSGLLSDLSYGLKAIIGQRLVKNKAGELQPVNEILLNTKYVADLIVGNKLEEVRDAMEKSLTPGSCTFEHALCTLYLAGTISYDTAMTAADSPTNFAWMVGQSQTAEGKKSKPAPSFSAFELSPQQAY